MSRIDPFSLKEDERWLLYVSLAVQKLIDRGIVVCERGNIMPPRLVKKTQQMVDAHPELFHAFKDDDLFNLAVQALNIRYGISVREDQVMEMLSFQGGNGSVN